jgi:hypothetical protein
MLGDMHKRKIDMAECHLRDQCGAI